MISEYSIIALTLLSAFIAAYAQYLFKRAVPRFKMNLKEISALFRNRLLMLAIVIYLLDLVIYLFALKFGQLSFVYPVFASSFLFTLAFAQFALHEKMGVKRLLGIAFIFTGILLVALSY